MTLPHLTVIPAGAGSGKTHAIQTRLVRWVKDGLVAPERIAAVTYTEAAAAELRGRIRGALLAEDRVEDALRLERAYISTIHGFGSRVLRELAFEAGVALQPRLLAEAEEALLLGVALAETERLDDVMGRLREFGYVGAAHKNQWPADALRAAVGGVIRVLVDLGADGGGAAEVARLEDALEAHLRSEYGVTCDGEAATRVLRNAVRALLTRFPESLESTCGTSDAARTDFRNNHRDLREAAESERALERDWRLWKRLAELRCSRRGSPTPDGYDALAEDVMACAAALATHPGPLDDAVVHGRALVGAAAQALAHYRDVKRRRGLLDYHDMIALPLRLLDARPDVLRELVRRLDCLVIDEFQDTNPLQFALLWRLHRAGVPALVVGDTQQAIMGFQGADPRLFDAVIAAHPDESEPLAENWRSRPELMRLLNRVGAGLFDAAYTELAPQVPPSEGGLPPLVVHEAGGKKVREAERALVDEALARIQGWLGDPALRVRDPQTKTLRRLRPGDIAILSFAHNTLERYAAALRAAGLRTRRPEAGWLASPAVELGLRALACAADPGDRHAALAVAVSAVGESELEPALQRLLDGDPLHDPAVAALHALAAGRADRAVPELVDEIAEALDLHARMATWPDATQARADWLRLRAEAQHFHDMPSDALASAGLHGRSAKSFLAWLPLQTGARERGDQRPEARVVDEHAIELSTFHSAKGREWPAVLVVGLDEKIEARLPDLAVQYGDFSDLGSLVDGAWLEWAPRFDSQEAHERFRATRLDRRIDEARRLLYVALTRARECLVLEWPRYLVEKLKSGDDESLSQWRLLREETGAELVPGGLRVGGETFDALRVDAGAGGAGEPADPAPAEPALPRLGRRAIEMREAPALLTPDSVAPSSLHAEAPENADAAAALTVERYGSGLVLQADLDALARGDALHRAFELLLFRPERGPLLEAATGVAFCEEDAQRIGQAVADFEWWLRERLAPRAVRREVPFLHCDSAGSMVAGAMDLVLEADDAVWVIDHKSDRVGSEAERRERALVYARQVGAYRAALVAAGDSRPVRGMVHWVTAQEVCEVGGSEGR